MNKIMSDNIHVATFIGKVEGLKAASLHAQYFEEYLYLSKYVETLKIITDTVITNETNLPSNVEIIKLPKIGIPKIYGATKIAFYSLYPILKKNEIDILYVRTFSPPELSAIWLSKIIADLPSILVLPGTWLFGHPSESRGKEKFYRWFLRRALDYADKIVLYSRLMLPEVLLYHDKLDTTKITYIHNAVNVDRFSPHGEVSEYVINLKRDYRKCLLYVGRVNEKKGVGDLIDAFYIVNKQLNDVILLIIGSGPEKYLREITKRIKDYKLEDKVFLLGPIPNRDIPSFIRASDLVVYATREGEGIPRAILEAMACGKPAVATRVAGIPDAVINGLTGYLVEPRNPKELAEKILKLIKDDELLRKMGSNARKHIEKEFSYQVVVQSIARLLKDLAK